MPGCTWARTTCRRVDAANCWVGRALIGYSSHNARQLAAAGGEPVDYVAFGPMFPNRIEAQIRTP